MGFNMPETVSNNNPVNLSKESTPVFNELEEREIRLRNDIKESLMDKFKNNDTYIDKLVEVIKNQVPDLNIEVLDVHSSSSLLQASIDACDLSYEGKNVFFVLNETNVFVPPYSDAELIEKAFNSKSNNDERMLSGEPYQIIIDGNCEIRNLKSPTLERLRDKIRYELTLWDPEYVNDDYYVDKIIVDIFKKDPGIEFDNIQVCNASDEYGFDPISTYTRGCHEIGVFYLDNGNFTYIPRNTTLPVKIKEAWDAYFNDTRTPEEEALVAKHCIIIDKKNDVIEATENTATLDVGFNEETLAPDILVLERLRNDINEEVKKTFGDEKGDDYVDKIVEEIKLRVPDLNVVIIPVVGMDGFFNIALDAVKETIKGRAAFFIFNGVNVFVPPYSNSAMFIEDVYTGTYKDKKYDSPLIFPEFIKIEETTSPASIEETISPTSSVLDKFRNNIKAVWDLLSPYLPFGRSEGK